MKKTLLLLAVISMTLSAPAEGDALLGAGGDGRPLGVRTPTAGEIVDQMF